MFACAGCHAQVVLCRRCDRGQIYCGTDCSARARSSAQRAAGRRYQASRRGRFVHAARARRYRSRSKTVTHQGSPVPPAGDLLPSEALVPLTEVVGDPVAVEPTTWRCCVCGAPCADQVRLGFLRRGRPIDRPIGTQRKASRHDDSC
jgi:rubrerythrin